MELTPTSQTPRRPPHITVNSGSGGNILQDLRSDGSSMSTPNTAGLTRQLLPAQGPAPGQRSVSNGSSNGAGPLYGSPIDSQEMLLPPARSRGPRPYQDLPAEAPSRTNSAMSSRRTSWSSEGGRRESWNNGSPFISPFDDSRAPSRSGDSEDENINTQTVSEKYNIMPSAGLLLFPEDVEKDDWLHNPSPDDKDGVKCDIWNRRGMVNLGALTIMTIGLLFLFIGYPVLTFVERVIPTSDSAVCAATSDCLSANVALLSNVRQGLIDPDTPSSVKTRTSADGKALNLVFSDEFNTDGRTFYDGDDPFFQGVDLWYGVTQDKEWYDPDAITTEGGTLNIKFDAFQSHNLNYRSGMLQSWNKLCFTGGRLEASISLPGSGNTTGFWPGFWAMGNLGRPGYAATSEGLWPYSYWDKCDAGITPNQSSTDGVSWLPGMKLPACTCTNQDHPSPGNSRSAPEIDAIEASVGYLGPGSYDNANGDVSQSFQAAPFDIWYEPDSQYMEVYDYSQTQINNYRGGPYQQSVSGLTWVNNDWYDGKGYQKYGFEYNPGDAGDITWFVGEQYAWKVDARALRPNGNVGQRMIPMEPMSIIVNFGMSDSFSQVFLSELSAMMPATMRVDYIRIYQEAGSESITCDPTDYPTTTYIANHPKAYENPNITSWSGTNYTWPTNSLMDGCTAENYSG
ncbi:putative glucan synthase subunit KRE6 [Coleophoma cylindrospora]|uniref:Putative glucan synthase subunit KRE6 n=1 Tax=Coleophoma cylindrospora TaxID=1849047 RepID=A0A3D8S700_9HELO|nr:putative glucan synthase subunit KRE6 [Coleophoma cylindrospora]